jgi:hypothetical protein
MRNDLSNRKRALEAGIFNYMVELCARPKGGKKKVGKMAGLVGAGRSLRRAGLSLGRRLPRNHTVHIVAQQTDPLSVLKALFEARNAQNAEAAAFFAEGATIINTNRHKTIGQ